MKNACHLALEAIFFFFWSTIFFPPRLKLAKLNAHTVIRDQKFSHDGLDWATTTRDGGAEVSIQVGGTKKSSP